MSLHNLPVVLSEAAKDDIIDILQYTHDLYGDEQMHVYGGVIDKTLATLSAYPLLGKEAREISEQHRFIKAGQHIIFYKVMDGSIHIARILHHRMAAKNHL